MTRREAIEYAVRHASGREYPNDPRSRAAFRALLPVALREKADRAAARDWRKKYGKRA